jgi:hypothetical protein
MHYNPRTEQQNRYIYWLLGQLGVTSKDAIAEIVSDWTQGRTTRTSDLQFIEAQTIIKLDKLDSFKSELEKI